VEILALDVGSRRVGIARADSLARLPEPLKTVKTKEAIPQLQAMIKENNVEAIVIGLPRNLSGEDTPQTGWVRNWASRAKAQLDIPLYWQDEALSTKVAETRHRDSKDQHVDALAAVVILQDFLVAAKEARVLV